MTAKIYSHPRFLPNYWDENIEAISDDFVIGDEDTFLNVGFAMERLHTLDYSDTDAMIIIEGWIADALF